MNLFLAIRAPVAVITFSVLAASCVTDPGSGSRASDFYRYTPRDDETIIVGRAFVRPPLDVLGYAGSSIALGLVFSDSRDSPLAAPGSNGGYRPSATAPIGQDSFFVQRVPRHSTYLRALQITRYIRVQSPYTYGYPYGYRRPATTTSQTMWCSTSKYIPIEPTDAVIYIGTFICERQQASRVVAYDEYEQLRAYWPQLVADRVPVKRMPLDEELSPPPPPPAVIANPSLAPTPNTAQAATPSATGNAAPAPAPPSTPTPIAAPPPPRQ